MKRIWLETLSGKQESICSATLGCYCLSKPRNSFQPLAEESFTFYLTLNNSGQFQTLMRPEGKRKKEPHYTGFEGLFFSLLENSIDSHVSFGFSRVTPHIMQALPFPCGPPVLVFSSICYFLQRGGSTALDWQCFNLTFSFWPRVLSQNYR